MSYDPKNVAKYERRIRHKCGECKTIVGHHWSGVLSKYLQINLTLKQIWKRREKGDNNMLPHMNNKHILTHSLTQNKLTYTLRRTLTHKLSQCQSIFASKRA